MASALALALGSLPRALSAHARAQIMTACTSLRHLLDYDEEDDDEATFEVIMFGEAFHEMLMRNYATTIFNHLLGRK